MTCPFARAAVEFPDYRLPSSWAAPWGGKGIRENSEGGVGEGVSGTARPWAAGCSPSGIPPAAKTKGQDKKQRYGPRVPLNRPCRESTTALIGRRSRSRSSPLVRRAPGAMSTWPRSLVRQCVWHRSLSASSRRWALGRWGLLVGELVWLVWVLASAGLVLAVRMGVGRHCLGGATSGVTPWPSRRCSRWVGAPMAGAPNERPIPQSTGPAGTAGVVVGGVIERWSPSARNCTRRPVRWFRRSRYRRSRCRGPRSIGDAG